MLDCGPVSVLDWHNWVLDWVAGFGAETGPELRHNTSTNYYLLDILLPILWMRVITAHFWPSLAFSLIQTNPYRGDTSCHFLVILCRCCIISHSYLLKTCFYKNLEGQALQVLTHNQTSGIYLINYIVAQKFIW